MGYYVAVNFSFLSNNSEGSLKTLQEAAKKTKTDMAGNLDRYTGFMLEDVIEEPAKLVYGGNKGDMFMWGGVWNYYNADGELPALKAFMLNCYQPHLKNLQDECIFDFERAMLLVNTEQTERTDIYQIGLRQHANGDYLNEIEVKKQTIDLNWNEM